MLAIGALLALVPWPTRAVARRFLFPAYRVAPLPAPAAFEALTARAEDGTPVRMLFEPPRDASARVVVVFHGNSESMVQSAWLADALEQRGFGALLVEYRGYGLSRDAGEPTEDGLYQDAEAALATLRTRGVDHERVVLFGYSLGTGVASEMARRGRGAALVLVAPFTSIPDVVTDVVPGLPASVLVGDHFDTLAKAADIRVPTLVIHGDRDEVVPYWMGQKLAATLPFARFIGVPSGRHGDLFARDREPLLAAITRLARSAS